MSFLLLWIQMISAIQLCAAFPITTVTFGEHNAFMLATVTIFLFGVAVIGCVCCRRRKKGFEEFQNESGITENNKTEYPIFRALSPENQRSSPALSANVVTASNSNENLITGDYDNNNGPISPADLENIENNNAVDYIQNQNEIIDDDAASAAAIDAATIAASSTAGSSTPSTSSSSSSSLSQLTRNRNLVEINQLSTIKEIHNHISSDILQDVTTTTSTINTTTSTEFLKSKFPECHYHNLVEERKGGRGGGGAGREENQKNNSCMLKNSSPLPSSSSVNVEIHTFNTSFYEKFETTNVTTEVAINNNNSNTNNINNNENICTPMNVPILIENMNNCNKKRNILRTNGDDDEDDERGGQKGVGKEEKEGGNSSLYYEKLTVIDIEPDLNESFVDVAVRKGGKTVDKDEDVSSLKSQSSFNEDNSVNEALKALDDAIEGEDLYDDDDDENYSIHDEVFDENSTDFQYVIQQLLINNKITENDEVNCKEWINENCNDDEDGEDDEDDEDDQDSGRITPQPNEIDYNEMIRDTAKIFVDNILRDSERIVEMKLNELNKSIGDNPEKTILHAFSERTPHKNEEIKTEINLNVHQKQKSNNDYVDDEDDGELLRSNSCEDFFTAVIEASTPCIRAHTLMSGENNFPKKRSNQKCLEDLFEKTVDKDDKDINETKTFQIVTSPVEDKTFEVNKTFDLNNKDDDFIYPGDPCTSRQALERDHGYSNCDRDDMNSADLTTLTPVNTPIELNYPYETWNQMMQKVSNTNLKEQLRDDDDNNDDRSLLNPHTTYEVNQTFDVDEDNEVDLESTFEALKKQLAEILPQPQGITGPPEYSDEDEDNNETGNRTFDEYRSPLDGIIGLLEAETSAPSSTQNELFINYKRSLSPIMEESEDETCKTFVMNETKCLDSTSGCLETGEAIMGVTKALMASNDTLFNFEDTLGEKEDVFSPRIPSRTEIHSNVSTKSDNSAATPTESSDTEKGINHRQQNQNSNSEHSDEMPAVGRRTPPKTIDFIGAFELKQDSELCSPDQQKTFSDGTSSTTDRISSDISVTVDHDTTFTTNTVDEKTCITVIVKDDERISEISEPEWGSTASYAGCELNSLTDVPSLDFNINNLKKEISDDCKQEASDHAEKLSSDENISTLNDGDDCHDDSGHSTQASTTDDKSISNNISSAKDIINQSDIDDKSYFNATTLINQLNKPSSSSSSSIIIFNDMQSSRDFIKNEIDYSSSHNGRIKMDLITSMNDDDIHKKITMTDVDLTMDGSKENTNPNVKTNLYFYPNESDKISISYQKVQIFSQDSVIVDRKNNISPFSKYMENENELMTSVITRNDVCKSTSVNDTVIDENSVQTVESKQNDENYLNPNNEIIGCLSGEEDPWVNEIIQSTFCTNECESDADDSHSSEEFMYIRGSPSKEDIMNISNENNVTAISNHEQKISSDDKTVIYNESNLWASTKDAMTKPKKIKNLTSEDVSEEDEDGSSEFEEEFIPSCWDSMAMPARSALKSPDKPANKNKKHRNVAFKMQRYHSVYEYPKENTSLLSASSESSLWNKTPETGLYLDANHKEEFSDGFTVSSSMRPFHGCQFNVLCHTWPTDSDFSWSQMDGLNSYVDNKPLVTYSDVEMKWPKSNELLETNMKTNQAIDVKRPDSGVGESAEMLSDRTSIGELCHTKSNLHLPLELLPLKKANPTDDNNQKPIIINDNKETAQHFTTESIVLPTPSCTGSMDSLSSSSGSERQTINFTTFGKINPINNIDKRQSVPTEFVDQLKPAIIICEEPIDTQLMKNDKIKQSDSTDEDSGIESIMKVNK